MPPSHRRKSAPLWQRHLPKFAIALVGAAALGGGAYLATKKTSGDHLKAGVALHQAGDFKGATIELKNTLQAAPDNAQARYLLGQTYYAASDFQSAEKELSKARGLGIKHDSLLPLLARTLIALNQPKRVLDEIKEADGSSAELKATILALRAQAYLILKDAAAAEKSMAAADVLSPDHAETLAARANLAFALGQKENALNLVEKAIAKDGKRADLWVLKGYLLRTSGQKDGALAAYTKALTFEPANFPALLANAELHFEGSDLGKAEADVKQIKKLMPDAPMATYLEAMLDFRHNRFAEAGDKLQRVLRVAPDMMRAHLLSGAANLALGKREEAKANLNRVLAVAPQHPLARKLMAATLADLGDIDQAKKMIASFESEGNDPILNALKSGIALRQGNYVEARKQLENMGTNAPQTPQYFTDLAASRMGTGDEGGAVQALTKAAELDAESTTPDILLVLTHLKSKRFDEAMKAVDKLAKERPNDPLIDNLRGSIYLSQGEKAQARTSFTKALQSKPSYFPAASNLALLDMAGKDAKAARSRFEQLLKSAPGESRAWLALAAFESHDKNEAGYLKALEQAKKASAKNAQAHQLLIRYWLGRNDAGKALSAANEALTATGRPEFNEYIGLAQMMQKDSANALVSFQRWVEISPGNPMAHFRLAQAQIVAKNKEAALKALDKALALRSDFIDASVNKSILLSQMGRSADAIKIARGVQASAPRAAAGFLAEAEVLFADKKYLDAGKLFAKAAQMTGQGQPLARAYQAYAAAGQPADGEKLLDQWLKTQPNDAFVRHQLALVLLNAKRLKESAEHYRALIRANPKDLAAYNNLAWLLGELKAPEAVATAEQAYKLNPENPAMQDTLGWILVNAGQTQRGIELLKMALGKAASSAEIHWHLAAALAKAGDRKSALANLEILLGSGRDFPQKAEAINLFNQLKENSR